MLHAGAEDKQQLHSEDDVYYVTRGSGTFQMGSEEVWEDYPVSAGRIVFVKAGVKHRFHRIVEELVVLVLFVPAEST